ncbi:hypothetical protein, partial [Bacillus cereus group sp. BfR-BA-01356]|uniref:hypothetical protein n=1 Tax=Bacillus cereus group sp. BfR-BA-01356 TaxID=2920319 RepID=UPI001F59C8F0
FYIKYWSSFVMSFLSNLSFDNFKRYYFSVDILPQVFLQILLYNIRIEFWENKEKGAIISGDRAYGNKINYFNRGRVTKNIGATK